MIRAVFSFLTSTLTWLLSNKVATGGPSAPASNRLVSSHGYFAGNLLIERVAGTWQSSGLSGLGAISDDGLTAAFGAYNATLGGHVLVYRRPSTSVSFSTVSPVTLDMPDSTPDGYSVLTPNRIALSGNGNKVVITCNHADRFVVATGVFTSSWTLQTFSVVPGTGFFVTGVTLSPTGTRLAIWYNTSLLNLYYTGIPSLPWEDVGTLSSNSHKSSAWVSDSCLVAATSSNEITVYNRPVASSSMALSATLTRTDLGIDPSLQIGVLAVSVDKLLLLQRSNYLLVFSGVSTTGTWTLVGREDIALGFEYMNIIQASSNMRQVLAVNNINTPVDPYTAFLFER